MSIRYGAGLEDLESDGEGGCEDDEDSGADNRPVLWNSSYSSSSYMEEDVVLEASVK